MALEPQVNPGVPNIFEQSSAAYGAGTGAMSDATGIIGDTVLPNALPMSINAMMNPYMNQVIDNAVGRLRERKAIDLNQVQADAAGASAFGGARHGLVEANLIDAYGQQEDELVSRLLQSGFDTSSNLAISDLIRRTNAGTAMAGVGGGQIDAAQTGFNLGSSAVAGQAAAGADQQNLIQRILSGADIETQNYLTHPMRSLTAIMAGLAGNPLNQATTTTQETQINPGIGQMLGGGLSILGAAK